MHSKNVYLLFPLIIIILIAGCSQNNHSNNTANNSELIQSNVSTDNAGNIIDFRNEKTQLIEMMEFDGQESKQIMINRKEVTAEWLYNHHSDFGFYLPPQMKKVKLYEGHSYKTQDELGELSVLDSDLTSDSWDPFLDSELTQYTEYFGSEDWGGNILYHYFLIEYKDSIATISLRINDKNSQEEVLPILLDVMRTIKYVPIDKQ